jgi:hypothetical protein
VRMIERRRVQWKMSMMEAMQRLRNSLRTSPVRHYQSFRQAEDFTVKSGIAPIRVYSLGRNALVAYPLAEIPGLRGRSPEADHHHGRGMAVVARRPSCRGFHEEKGVEWQARPRIRHVWMVMSSINRVWPGTWMASSRGVVRCWSMFDYHSINASFPATRILASQINHSIFEEALVKDDVADALIRQLYAAWGQK